MTEVESFHCQMVSWPEIQQWCDQLSYAVEDSDWLPDSIVGLTRGGLVPARIVCDHFANKNLYTVKVEHWGVTAQPDGEARLTSPLSADLGGQKVLVVDDITDTGKSLLTALAHVEQTGKPAEVKCGVMLHLSGSSYRPDYVAVEPEEWTWFIFPWNIYEDLTHLAPKAIQTPGTIEDIAAALETQFHITPPADVLERVLSRLQQKGGVDVEDGMYSRA